MLSQRRIGMFWIILAISGYAFLPIFTRKIYEYSELVPTDLALWRFIFATPIIWVGVLLRERMSQKQNKVSHSIKHFIPMFALGLLYVGATLSAFFGLQYIPASTYVVLFYTYPAFVALISIFLGQSLNRVGWLALFLTLIGMILTFPDFRLTGENTLLGVSIALFNSFVIAIYFLLVKRLMSKVPSVARGSAYVISWTFIILLLTVLPFNGLNFPQSLTVWLLLLGVATISTAMPILVINMGIQIIGATQAAIVSTAEPLMAMILAFLLLSEIILPVQWLGAIFIIGGVILLELRSRQKAVH